MPALPRCWNVLQPSYTPVVGKAERVRAGEFLGVYTNLDGQSELDVLGGKANPDKDRPNPPPQTIKQCKMNADSFS
jgi:hypothetical protein